MGKLKTHKYENIILEIIQANPRFSGNEGLLEPIYNNVLERLGSVVDSINDETVVREYIQKVTKLAIIHTIKRYGTSTTERVVVESKPVTSQKVHSEDVYKVFSYRPIEQNQELYISKNDLVKIEQEIIKLNENSQHKEFLNLYSLRYTKNKSIEEISDDLNISQAQVAERLFEISALVKRICGNEVSQV